MKQHAPSLKVETLVVPGTEGNFSIVTNQILVDRPELNAISKNGVWNFQPLLNLADPANTSSPSTSPNSGGSLPLPLAEIDLQELNIRNASAKLDIDGDLFASLKGLSLEAKGKANLDVIDLNLRVIMEAGPTSNIKLGSILGEIPADLKGGLGLTELDGTVELSIKAKGNLPISEENLKPVERWTKIFATLDPDNLPPSGNFNTLSIKKCCKY